MRHEIQTSTAVYSVWMKSDEDPSYDDDFSQDLVHAILTAFLKFHPEHEDGEFRFVEEHDQLLLMDEQQYRNYTPLTVIEFPDVDPTNKVIRFTNPIWDGTRYSGETVIAVESLNP